MRYGSLIPFEVVAEYPYEQVVVVEIYMVVEISYLLIVAISMTASALYIYQTKENTGEFSGFDIINLTKIDVFFYYIMSILSLVLVVLVYACFKRFKIGGVNGYRLEYNEKRLHYTLFVVIFLQIAFLINTGVGRVLSNATSVYSPIFSLLDPSVFFIFYFILYRKLATKLFLFNVFLFLSWKLLQGWTGTFLTLFLCEAWYRVSMIKSRRFKGTLYLLIPITVICIGSIVYKFAYPIKNEIRGLDSSPITYSESISKLSSRLSYFPIAIGAADNLTTLKKLFLSDEITMKEVVAIGRPILPSFIMQNKDFRSLSNNVVQLHYPNVTYSTGSNMGLYMYLKTIYYIDALQFISISILLIVSTLCIKVLCDLSELERGGLNFFMFLYLSQVVDVAVVENLVGYNFIKLLIFLAFLFIINQIGFRRKHHCSRY
ncbi:TPA: oligosaccharide repeat unit polymerase [Vibrio cholerae]